MSLSLFQIHGISNYPSHFINEQLILIESGTILSCLNIENGQQHFVLALTEFDSILCVASNPSNKIFVIALQSDKAARIELYSFDDIGKITLLHSFEECSSVGYSHIDISNNGQYMIAISNIPHLQIEFWSICHKHKLASTNIQFDDTKYVSFSPTSHEVFMTANNHTIILWRVYFKFDQYFLTQTVHSLTQTRQITSIMFGEGGNEIIYCNNLGEMVIFDENTAAHDYNHNIKHRFSKPEAIISTLLFTRFYYIVIESDKDGTIQFISKNNFQKIYQYNLGSSIKHCIFTPNYKQLIIVNKENKLINCSINQTLLIDDNQQFIKDTNLIQQNEIFNFIQIKPNQGFNIIALQTNDCMLFSTQQNLKLVQLSDTNANTFDFPICNVSTMEVYHYNHGIDLIALGFNDGHFGLCYVNNAANIKLFFAQHLFTNSIKQIGFDSSGTLIACICNQESKIWFVRIIPDAEPQILGYYELNNVPICCCWVRDENDSLKIIISFNNGFVSTYDAPHYNGNSDELLLESHCVDCEVDFSLQKIIRDPNETSPDRLLCLTEDNKLKAFVLDDHATVSPDDSFVFDDHRKRITDIRIQSGLLLTSSMDGCVLIIRYLSESESDSNHILASLYAHNASYIAKGILCAQFVHSGAKIISVGFDGSVISWQLDEDIQFANEDIRSDCPLTVQYLNQITEAKINKNEIVYQEKIENERISNKKKAFEPTLHEIKNELEQLRRNYRDIVEKVNNASELEKLEENELIVDNKQFDLLLNENKKEIGKICEEIEYENIGKQLIMRRIKEECYDGMTEKLQIVGGIKCHEKVTTFPILSQDKNDLLLNKKLQFLRKMNIIEQEWSTKTQDRVRMEFDIKRPMNNKSIKYIWDINELKEKQTKEISEQKDPKKEKDDKPTKKDKQNENDNADRVHFPVSQQLKNLLYHPMKLYTNYSKRIQINLLNLRMRALKSCFNKEIGTIFKLKTAEIERINEMALEISDIEKELAINTSNVNVYKLADDEDKERIFKVNDSEINVKKVLTETELNKLKESKVETLQRLKNANNDLTERALLEMMNNRLDSKDEVERLKDTLKKPECMDEIDESEWSEQQKTNVLQYEEKKAALTKAKEIRIKLLQTRLKSLKNDLNEICKNFDSKLKMLYNIRLCVMGDIYVHELMLIHLINDIIEHEQYNKKIENMNLELIRLKQDKKKADLTYNQFNTKLEEYKNKLIDLLHNDKYLVKQFKKEFNPNTMNGVADYFDYLFKLFRGKKAVAPKPNANLNKSIQNLERKTSSFSNTTNDTNSDRLSTYRSKTMHNKISSELLLINDTEIEEEKEEIEEKEESNPYFIETERVNDGSGVDLSYLVKPMDLSCNVWNRFLEFRKLKLYKDKEINDLNEQICSMEAEVNALDENKQIILESIQEINKSATEMITKKKKYKLDCELFFCLKQGNVEILELPVVTDMRQSVLLNRNVIQNLNAIILNAGSQHIEQLNEIKQFRRGINLLNWRNKILDLEYRYYTLLTTEYQLRRVTKKDQEILTIGGFNDNNSKKNEIKSLEKKLVFTKSTINTKIKERKKENNKYINRIAQIKKSNDDLLKEIKKLKNDVFSKQDIVNIRGTKSMKNEKKESNKKRMDTIVTRRKLVDLVKAQSDEIQFLRNELDRLRRKTFPSFSIADSQ